MGFRWVICGSEVGLLEGLLKRGIALWDFGGVRTECEFGGMRERQSSFLLKSRQVQGKGAPAAKYQDLPIMYV